MNDFHFSIRKNRTVYDLLMCVCVSECVRKWVVHYISKIVNRQFIFANE